MPTLSWSGSPPAPHAGCLFQDAGRPPLPPAARGPVLAPTALPLPCSRAEGTPCCALGPRCPTRPAPADALCDPLPVLVLLLLCVHGRKQVGKCTHFMLHCLAFFCSFCALQAFRQFSVFAFRSPLSRARLPSPSMATCSQALTSKQRWSLARAKLHRAKLEAKEEEVEEAPCGTAGRRQ